MRRAAHVDDTSVPGAAAEVPAVMPGSDHSTSPLRGERDRSTDPQTAGGLARLTEADSPLDDGLGDFGGDDEREPALGFYLALGAIVAVLLLAVYSLSASRGPIEDSASRAALSAHSASPVPIRPTPGFTSRSQPTGPILGPLDGLKEPFSDETPRQPATTDRAGSSSPSGGDPSAGLGAISPSSPPAAGGSASGTTTAVPSRTPPIGGSPARVPSDTLELPSSSLLSPVSPAPEASGAPPALRGGRQRVVQ